MANFAFKRMRNGRLAVIFALGVALLLPTPGKCASCLFALGSCPHCAASKALEPTEQAPTKSCCHQQTACESSPPAAASATSVVTSGHRVCGCSVQSAPRAVPTVVKLVSPADDVAATFPTAVVTDQIIHQSAASVLSLGELPPSVPHRILHCSWII
jgi:hypothetical protein